MPGMGRCVLSLITKFKCNLNVEPCVCSTRSAPTCRLYFAHSSVSMSQILLEISVLPALSERMPAVAHTQP